MGNVLISLDEEEQLMLQRICLDKEAPLPGKGTDATREVGGLVRKVRG